MNERTALHLWIVLSRAARAIEEHAGRDVARHDLSLAEFGVLEALHHLGPLRLCDLREKILVSSGGISYLVDRLEERGLVRRHPDPEDRRARRVALTEGGASFVERIFPEHAACLERAMSGLPREEQVRAIRLLRRLGRHATDLLEDGSGTEA